MPPTTIDPNIKEYLDRMTQASADAYGPVGVVAACLVAVIVIILLIMVGAQWWAARSDKKYENIIRERAMKQEHDDTVLLAQTFQELTGIIKSLGPSHTAQTDRVINHIDALLTALLERAREGITKENHRHPNA